MDTVNRKVTNTHLDDHSIDDHSTEELHPGQGDLRSSIDNSNTTPSYSEIEIKTPLTCSEVISLLKSGADATTLTTHLASLSASQQLQLLIKLQDTPKQLTEVFPFIDIAKFVDNLQKEQNVIYVRSEEPGWTPNQEIKTILNTLQVAIAEEPNASSYIDQFLAIKTFCDALTLGQFLGTLPIEEINSESLGKIKTELTEPTFLQNIFPKNNPNKVHMFFLFLNSMKDKKSLGELKTHIFKSIIEHISFSISEPIPTLEKIQERFKIDIGPDNVRSLFLQNVKSTYLSTNPDDLDKPFVIEPRLYSGDDL